VRLSDRFGDNGTIGVVICRPREASVWEIDTWLMSCRVLGRRVEQMTLRELVRHARDRGVTRLIGAYLPTPKNAMVADLYAKLGFALVARDESGASRWELRTDVDIDPAPMSVERAGFESVAV
jgi:FkbH-like protein